jgi:predicted RNA-binding Zn ribbon-like protein
MGSSLPNPAPAPGEAESVALALVNTQVESRGELLDLLPDARSLRLWLRGHGLPAPPVSAIAASDLDQIHALRDATRASLMARIDGRRACGNAITMLNDLAALAPRVPRLKWSPDGPQRSTAIPTEVAPMDAALAALAGSAIETITGSDGPALRACGAHNCVRLFIQDHGRRQWCSQACGDRVRFARYYEKTRATD